MPGEPQRETVSNAWQTLYLTSSVTHTAGASACGVRALPKALVVLVKINESTPANVASSRRLSVPVMLVSMKCCQLCVMTCGLCRVAVYRTACTSTRHRLTKSRSLMDPTLFVKSDDLMSRPMASCFVFLKVRTSASPKCPLLPVTKTFILMSLPLVVYTTSIELIVSFTYRSNLLNRGRKLLHARSVYMERTDQKT